MAMHREFYASEDTCIASGYVIEVFAMFANYSGGAYHHSGIGASGYICKITALIAGKSRNTSHDADQYPVNLRLVKVFPAMVRAQPNDGMRAVRDAKSPAGAKGTLRLP